MDLDQEIPIGSEMLSPPDAPFIEFSYFSDGERRASPHDIFPELRSPTPEPTLGRFIVTRNYRINPDASGALCLQPIIDQVRFHLFTTSNLQSLSAQHSATLAEVIARGFALDEALMKDVKRLIRTLRAILKSICLPVVGVIDFTASESQPSFHGRMSFQPESSLSDFINGNEVLKNFDFFKREVIQEFSRLGIVIEDMEVFPKGDKR